MDTRAVDLYNCCRPSALLGILQEAATDAAVVIHASRSEIVPKYHAFWMLARVWFGLDRPLRWNERLTVTTWHRGGKGAAMYRDFDLAVEGARVGEAVSTWVLADIDTHKLRRLSCIPDFADTGGGVLCKEKLLGKLRLPEGLALAERRRLHYSDTDINGHVNNSKYADYVCDALHMERLGRGHFVSSLQLGYLAECLPGEEISLLAGEQDGNYYVRGADTEHVARFDAVLTLGQVSEEPIP